MKFDEYEIKFVVGKYNEDNSTYIGAVVMEDGEPVEYYDDVTICSMHTAIGGEEVALDTNNSRELINAMVENGLIEIMPYIAIRSGYCEYPKGRITKKFFDEIAGDKIEAYNTVFANELKEER